MSRLLKKMFTKSHFVKRRDTPNVQDSVEVLVKKGAEKAVRDYKKTFEILAEYDKQ